MIDRGRLQFEPDLHGHASRRVADDHRQSTDADHFDDMFFAPYLSGASGFTKHSAGILTVGGVVDAAQLAGNNLKGVANVAGGMLHIATGFTYYDATNLTNPQAKSIDSINLQKGTTLDLQQNIGFPNVTVPAAANVTVKGAAGSFISNITSTPGTDSTHASY